MDAAAPVAASTPWSIRLDEVTVRYPNGTIGLNRVSLDIDAGEMVAVVGLSGSGKSTLIRTINGLVPVTSGTLDVGEHRVSGASPRTLRRLRGDIGMVFQGFNLAGRASVLNNVLVGRLAHTSLWRTLLGAYPEADKQLAYQALDRVGILPTSCTPVPPSSQADSSSASRSPAPLPRSRASCLPTNPSRASIRPPRTA